MTGGEGMPMSATQTPKREISISAAIALAQASCRQQERDWDRLTAGCRFAGTHHPGQHLLVSRPVLRSGRGQA
jgi:hypothetical protein